MWLLLEWNTGDHNDGNREQNNYYIHPCHTNTHKMINASKHWLLIQFITILTMQCALAEFQFSNTHTQLFNGPLSGTIQVDRYQKKHSPSHSHPDNWTFFINYLHLVLSKFVNIGDGSSIVTITYYLTNLHTLAHTEHADKPEQQTYSRLRTCGSVVWCGGSR